MKVLIQLMREDGTVIHAATHELSPHRPPIIQPFIPCVYNSGDPEARRWALKGYTFQPEIVQP